MTLDAGTGPERGPHEGELDDRDRPSRTAALSLAAQLSGAFFTVILTVFLVRKLGPAEYGIFALAVSVGLMAVLVADFGISSSTARFVAEHRSRRDVVARFVADALRLKLIASGAFSVALALLAPAIAHAYGFDEMTTPIRGVAIAIFGQSLATLFLATFLALGKLGYHIRYSVFEGIAELSASVSLVLLGTGAAGAAFGRGFGHVVGALLVGFLILKVLGPRSFAIGKTAGHERQIATYAAALLVVDGATAIFSQVDILIIGALLDPESVGLFEAPMRLVTFLQYGGLAAAAALAPRLARTADEEPDVKTFALGLRWVILVQALLLAPLVVWSEPIVQIALGSSYAESAEVLRALVPFVFLAGVGPAIVIGVNYLGEGTKRIPIAVGAIGINVVFDLIFIPKIGIVAGAIGSAIAFAFYVPAHLLICKRTVELPIKPIALSVVRALSAATLAGVVLMSFGTSELSLGDWLIAPPLALATYAAALLVVNELKWSEVQDGAATAKRISARFR